MDKEKERDTIFAVEKKNKRKTLIKQNHKCKIICIKIGI
jgi:hypothetical protein